MLVWRKSLSAAPSHRSHCNYRVTVRSGFTLESALTRGLVERVLRGKLHAAWGIRPVVDEDLWVQPVGREGFSLCLPKSFPGKKSSCNGTGPSWRDDLLDSQIDASRFLLESGQVHSNPGCSTRLQRSPSHDACTRFRGSWFRCCSTSSVSRPCLTYGCGLQAVYRPVSRNRNRVLYAARPEIRPS